VPECAGMSLESSGDCRPAWLSAFRIHRHSFVSTWNYAGGLEVPSSNLGAPTEFPRFRRASRRAVRRRSVMRPELHRRNIMTTTGYGQARLTSRQEKACGL
jgi:hypothetical protein